MYLSCKRIVFIKPAVIIVAEIKYVDTKLQLVQYVLTLQCLCFPTSKPEYIHLHILCVLLADF